MAVVRPDNFLSAASVFSVAERILSLRTSCSFNICSSSRLTLLFLDTLCLDDVSSLEITAFL